MAIVIRDGTPGDAALIAEFNQRLAWESEDKSLDPDTVRAGVAAALADPAVKGPYFLAEIDGRVVGQIQVTFEWSDWRNGWFWWIQGVYVAADARRKGVFRALFQHALQKAKAAKAVAMRLYVEKENRVARKTYEDLGMSVMSFDMMHLPFGDLKKAGAQA